MSERDLPREELLTRIDTKWNRLLAKLESFSEDELNIPDAIGIWSLKDLIGHLETWDRIAILKIQFAEQGETRPWWQVLESPFNDIDEFNEADAVANRDKSIDQLWRELHECHDLLLEKIRSSDAVTSELIAVDTWEHYQVHLEDIEAWERQRPQPQDAQPD